MTLRWCQEDGGYILQSSFPLLGNRGPKIKRFGVEGGFWRTRRWNWETIAAVTWDAHFGGYPSLASVWTPSGARPPRNHVGHPAGAPGPVPPNEGPESWLTRRESFQGGRDISIRASSKTARAPLETRRDVVLDGDNNFSFSRWEWCSASRPLPLIVLFGYRAVRTWKPVR